MKLFLLLFLGFSFSFSSSLSDLRIKNYKNAKTNIDNLIKCLSEPTPKEKEWVENVKKRADFNSMKKPLYIQSELWEKFNSMSEGYELLIEKISTNDIKWKRYILIKLIDLHYTGNINFETTYFWKKHINNCSNVDNYIFSIGITGNLLISDLTAELSSEIKN